MNSLVVENIKTSFSSTSHDGVTMGEFETHLMILDLPPKSDTFMGYINGWKIFIRAFNLARCRPDWLLMFRARINELLMADVALVPMKLSTFDDDLDEYLLKLNSVDLLWRYSQDASYQRIHSKLEQELEAVCNSKGGIYSTMYANAKEKSGA